MITAIVLGVLVLLCGFGGTGAYFLVQNASGEGMATPAAAVEGFLDAALREHDVDKANRYVCSEARDKTKLGRKINELRAYEQRYKSPQYSWETPKVESTKQNTAVVTVSVKMVTSDDREASKQLRFVTVKDSGWWVCEIGDAG